MLYKFKLEWDGNMKTVKIFLASSMEELHTDRLEISSFIQGVNDKLNGTGQYVKLYKCENENFAVSQSRKQNDYNANICDSQLIVILFFKKVGGYTREEFDVAYEHLGKDGNPQIMVYFRDDGSAVSDEVKAMKELLAERNIEYKNYYEIDTVKQSILLWLRDKLQTDFCSGSI